jgi:hypothetical protein
VSKLDRVLKTTVLASIVEHDYDLHAAARDLGVTFMTITRMLRRWQLDTPLAGGRSTVVRYRAYAERCNAISKTLNGLQTVGGNQ